MYGWFLLLGNPILFMCRNAIYQRFSIRVSIAKWRVLVYVNTPPPCHLFTKRYNPGYNPKCTKDVRKQHKSMLRIYFNKCIISIVQNFSTEKFKIFALYIFQHIFYGIIQIPFFINSKLSRSSETFANKKFDTFALIVDIFLDYIT